MRAPALPPQGRPPAPPAAEPAPPRRPAPGGRGGRCEGRACQVRRGHPGPLTSAQVREADAARSRPSARSGLPPASPPDQVKREARLRGRARPGDLRLEAGGAAPRSQPPLLPASSARPPGGGGMADGGRRWALGRARQGCGAPSSLVGPGDPTVAPAPRGRARRRPRAADPPRLGRPWRPSNLCPLLFREWQGSNFAPRSVPALRPQS